MKKTIYLIIALLLLQLVAADFYYDVDLYYNRGELSLTALTLKPLLDDREIFNYGESIVEIISFNNSVLLKSSYDIPLLFFTDWLGEDGFIAGGETIILNETEVPVNLPYFEQAKTINFYDENRTLLLSVNVGNYAKGISTEEILDDKPEESETKKEIQGEVSKTKEENKPLTKIILILVAVLILIILTAFSLNKKKPKGF